MISVYCPNCTNNSQIYSDVISALTYQHLQDFYLLILPIMLVPLVTFLLSAFFVVLIILVFIPMQTERRLPTTTYQNSFLYLLLLKTILEDLLGF